MMKVDQALCIECVSSNEMKRLNVCEIENFHPKIHLENEERDPIKYRVKQR